MFALLLSVPLVLHACPRRRWVVAGLAVPLVAGLGVAGGSLSPDCSDGYAWFIA